MAIWIHHGAPGSYKSSGAIKSDVLKAIKEGRHVITNVRGFSEARCRRVLKPNEIGEGFTVTYLDTKVESERDRLARFFHWAPVGAFFLIDEVQRIWRPSWAKSVIRSLDYPGGADLANAADRPENLETAFDMHRHYNWDFVLTCPNIKGVRDEIRDPAETALRHVNMGILGFAGLYKTVLHTSDNPGTSAAHALQVKAFNRIPKRIFKLYDSTATGAVRDTAAGSSILSDPKILGLLLFMAGVYFYMYLHQSPDPQMAPEDAPIVQASGSADAAFSPGQTGDAVGSSQGSVSSGPLDSGRVPAGTVVSDDHVTLKTGPFAGYRLVITCRVMVRTGDTYSLQYCYTLAKGDKYLDIDLSDYSALFSAVRPVNDCYAQVSYDGAVYQAMCDPVYDAWATEQNRQFAASSGQVSKGDSLLSASSG